MGCFSSHWFNPPFPTQVDLSIVHAKYFKSNAGRAHCQGTNVPSRIPLVSGHHTIPTYQRQNVSMCMPYDTVDVIRKARQSEARQENRTIDGTWQNRVLPQQVQLNLAMPRLASNDEGATPVSTIVPCLAVQMMTEGQHW